MRPLHISGTENAPERFLLDTWMPVILATVKQYMKPGISPFVLVRAGLDALEQAHENLDAAAFEKMGAWWVRQGICRMLGDDTK